MIRTPDDWWKVLDRNWSNIAMLAYEFGKFDGGALIPDDLADETLSAKLTNFQAMTLLRERRDPKLARFLFGIWDAAPDVPQIHNYAGWSDLCDLLSEEWVFNEPEIVP